MDSHKFQSSQSSFVVNEVAEKFITQEIKDDPL